MAVRWTGRKRQMFLTDIRLITINVHQPGPQTGHLFHAAFIQNIAPLIVTAPQLYAPEIATKKSHQ